MVALGEVAALSRTLVDPKDLEADVPYVGLEHIERGGRLVRISTVGAAQIASTKVAFTQYDLLVGKLRPNLAKITAAPTSGVASTDILPVRPSVNLDRQYLLHYLRQQSVVDTMSSLATGANLPRLSPTNLLALQIPLPPLPEQRRIAAILDHVDALRAARRDSLAKLDELVAQAFRRHARETKGESCTLDAVAEVHSGITKGRKPPASELIDVPYLAVSNVQDGWLALEQVKFIAVSRSELARFEVLPGDLLLTEGGDPDKLGRGTIWRGELPLAIHQNHIFKVRVKDPDRVRPDYLSLAVRSRESRDFFLRSAKQTTGIATINKTQLRRTPVYVPSVAAQDVVVGAVRAIDAQRTRYTTQLAELDALFESLQSRAFRGEL
ncbi:restriction endonuclease subunit S [Microbacterium sp. NPDC055683]